MWAGQRALDLELGARFGTDPELHSFFASDEAVRRDRELLLHGVRAAANAVLSHWFDASRNGAARATNGHVTELTTASTGAGSGPAATSAAVALAAAPAPTSLPLASEPARSLSIALEGALEHQLLPPLNPLQHFGLWNALQALQRRASTVAASGKPPSENLAAAAEAAGLAHSLSTKQLAATLGRAAAAGERRNAYAARLWLCLGFQRGSISEWIHVLGEVAGSSLFGEGALVRCAEDRDVLRVLLLPMAQVRFDLPRKPPLESLGVASRPPLEASPREVPREVRPALGELKPLLVCLSVRSPPRLPWQRSRPVRVHLQLWLLRKRPTAPLHSEPTPQHMRGMMRGMPPLQPQSLPPPPPVPTRLQPEPPIQTEQLTRIPTEQLMYPPIFPPTPITTEPITTEPITTTPIMTEPIMTEPIKTTPIAPLTDSSALGSGSGSAAGLVSAAGDISAEGGSSAAGGGSAARGGSAAASEACCEAAISQPPRAPQERRPVRTHRRAAKAAVIRSAPEAVAATGADRSGGGGAATGMATGMATGAVLSPSHPTVAISVADGAVEGSTAATSAAESAASITAALADATYGEPSVSWPMGEGEAAPSIASEARASDAHASIQREARAAIESSERAAAAAAATPRLIGAATTPPLPLRRGGAMGGRASPAARGGGISEGGARWAAAAPPPLTDAQLRGAMRLYAGVAREGGGGHGVAWEAALLSLVGKSLGLPRAVAGELITALVTERAGGDDAEEVRQHGATEFDTASLFNTDATRWAVCWLPLHALVQGRNRQGVAPAHSGVAGYLAWDASSAMLMRRVATRANVRWGRLLASADVYLFEMPTAPLRISADSVPSAAPSRLLGDAFDSEGTLSLAAPCDAALRLAAPRRSAHLLIGVSGLLSPTEGELEAARPRAAAQALGSCWAAAASYSSSSEWQSLTWGCGGLSALAAALRKARGPTRTRAQPDAVGGLPDAVGGLLAFGNALQLRRFWQPCCDAARAAGQALAEHLRRRAAGERPVSLVGVSLGARVVWHCLEALADADAAGAVLDVVILAAPVTSNPQRWDRVRSVVGGRLVNAYVPHNVQLGALYRSDHLLSRECCGLAAVSADGVHNYDASDLVPDDSDAYHFAAPRLLEAVGVIEPPEP